jgi:hypothetical protein
MDINILEDEVAIILNQLMVKFRKLNLLKDNSTQFVIDDFGLIVCCINRIDYSEVKSKVAEKFYGWRTVFITADEPLSKKKDEVLWNLMRGGYMKWLRVTYPRQVKNVLLGVENLGRKIIEKRLELWDGQPKYNYFIEDNKAALRNNLGRELTIDPSFFDFMPEEVM